MGGVLIDEHGRADLRGLYAAGENAGGVHGGNRLNSNAIPDTQVFGHRAGVDAARFAAAHARGSFDARPVERASERLAKLRSDAVEAAPEFGALHEELKQAMTLGVGIVRSAEGLLKATSDARAIAEPDLRNCRSVRSATSRAALDIEDLCTIGDGLRAECTGTRRKPRRALPR